ncbi:MAG: phenylalanine--tRNA ligase subunit beta [Thermodesulfobacteriota bacterium]
MLVSFNWLKEFVDIDRSAENLADLLTMGGIEVEAVHRVGTGLDRVFTARIEEISPHPSSKKLSLTRISLGATEEVVVCGAPNIAVGQIVAYAAVGASLPSGLQIKKRKIKGVDSPGMICSEKELALGEDESGILVLENDVAVGLPLTEACPYIDDYILEVGITPNRGDCLSILGVARDVAALTGTVWRSPEFAYGQSRTKIEAKMALEVPDSDLCPRYVARLVEGVKVGPSPFPIRLRLARSGVRAISNVVDVTNLVLLESGQPLHAFDYAFLQGHKIVVRRCDPGERFVTLDGTERELPPNALMIRDGKRSVALAGIMGGLNSEIKDTTTSVLIESACFERFGIRRTAKALGMSTEASFRFERGIDPEGTVWAATRSAYLMHKLAGGTIADGILDAYPAPIRREAVRVRPGRVNRFLGTSIPEADMKAYLTRLGIRVEPRKDGSFRAVPPSWRWDLEKEEDMAEEIARLYGFQNIPVSTPIYRSAPDRTREERARLRRVLHLMNSAGFTEAITMSFTSKAANAQFSDGRAEELALLNPLTEDYVVMRQSLLPGVMSVMKRNLSFRCTDMRICEIGKTFSPREGQELPVEEVRLAGLAIGARDPQIWHYQRGELDILGEIVKRPEVDFYDMKGALEHVCEGLGVAGVEYVPCTRSFVHPGKSAEVLLAGESIGFLGELSPAVMLDHDLTAKVQVFEIAVEPLFAAAGKETVFKAIPRYPYVERDLSIIVREKTSGDDIKRLISREGHGIITTVVLFDLYKGKTIPEDHRSMAFRLRYQSDERTLTDEEVDEVHSRVVEALKEELGVQLRE